MSKPFEVYVAKDKESGSILYVGEGKVGRHQHVNSGTSHNRNINKHFFTIGKLDIDVIGTFDTKEEVEELEELLIHEIQPKYNGGMLRKGLGVIEKQKLTKRTNYRGYMLEYIGALEEGDKQKAEDIRAECELVADLVDELKPLKCYQYGFHWTKLKAIYDAEMGVSTIKKEQLPDVELGKWYSFKELKDLVNQSYEKAGIDKKGKAVDVLQWYNCKKYQRNRVEGYIIESVKKE